MYTRELKKEIQKWLEEDNVIIVYGARQVGKTTLVKEIATELDSNPLYIDCEEVLTQDILNTRNLQDYKTLIQDYKVVIFDEAQKVKHIGASLKLMHDHIKGVKLIATGSSSFELANKLSEPLTGRNYTYTLYPLSLKELSQKENMFALSSSLSTILRYGTYPKVFGSGDQKAQKDLKVLANDYIYRDTFEIEGGIRKPVLYKALVRQLATLVGQETTLQELSQKLNADRETIERYLDILEKSFIVKILRPLQQNKAREIMYPFKIYFYDLGVRNGVLNEFREIVLRDSREVGALWENFCVMERIKKNEYAGISKNYYFWRTKDQPIKEYDLVEEKDGHYEVYEMKWSQKKESQVKKYPIFFETYPKSKLSVIHNENWW